MIWKVVGFCMRALSAVIAAAIIAVGAPAITAFTSIGVGALSAVGRERARSHHLATTRARTFGVSLLMLLMLPHAPTHAASARVGSGASSEER